MPPRLPTDDPTNDTSSLDDIYTNLSGDTDASHQSIDDTGSESPENNTPNSQDDGQGSGEETQQNTTTPPPQEPPQANTADQDDVRRRIDQLTRTYIPAVERERDRALQERDNLRRSVQGLAEFQQNLTSHGLNPDEASIGLQLAAAYKANPVQTILNLIRNAQANGVQMPEGVPTPGIDANTVQQVIKQQLQPILAPLQQRQEQAREAGEIQNTINTFYGEFPDARIHEPVLAAYITNQGNQGRQVSLHTAYIELYKLATTNGYDWQQPLANQIAQRRNNPNTTSPPNLGTSRRTINPSTVNAPQEQYDPKLSWSQIVKQASREVGNR